MSTNSFLQHHNAGCAINPCTCQHLNTPMGVTVSTPQGAQGGEPGPNAEDAMRFGDEVAIALGSVNAVGLIEAETILRDKIMELTKLPASLPESGEKPDVASVFGIGRALALLREMHENVGRDGPLEPEFIRSWLGDVIRHLETYHPDAPDGPGSVGNPAPSPEAEKLVNEFQGTVEDYFKSAQVGFNSDSFRKRFHDARAALLAAIPSHKQEKT